jgi:hypothetical protein
MNLDKLTPAQTKAIEAGGTNNAVIGGSLRKRGIMILSGAAGPGADMKYVLSPEFVFSAEKDAKTVLVGVGTLEGVASLDDEKRFAETMEREEAEQDTPAAAAEQEARERAVAAQGVQGRCKDCGEEQYGNDDFETDADGAIECRSCVVYREAEENEAEEEREATFAPHTNSPCFIHPVTDVTVSHADAVETNKVAQNLENRVPGLLALYVNVRCASGRHLAAYNSRPARAICGRFATRVHGGPGNLEWVDCGDCLTEFAKALRVLA